MQTQMQAHPLRSGMIWFVCVCVCVFMLVNERTLWVGVCVCVRRERDVRNAVEKEDNTLNPESVLL